MTALGAERSVALRVDDVWKHFGATVALKGAGLLVREGTIHGLVGRNGAGKSTLVSIISGRHRADRGEVTFYPNTAAQPARDFSAPCATVYQQPRLFSYLSVAENLWIGREESWIVRYAERRARARSLMAEWNLDVDPERRILDLTVDQRQLVELARAFAAGKRFIILDEPTAALQGQLERKSLFAKIVALRKQGITFLYISHQLQEIFGLCDEVTILKDGQVVATEGVPDLTEERLINLMVGGALETGKPPKPLVARDREAEVLRVEDLGARGAFEHVSFALRRGESLGLVGPVGSGAIALAETLAGVRALTAGSINQRGSPMRSGRADLAIARGVSYVSADRHRGGLLPYMSVRQNLTLAALNRMSRLGWIRPSFEATTADKYIHNLSIQVSSAHQRIRELSGGNQQKVMIARALACDPSLLILANPTVGIDVAVKKAVYELMDDLKAQGVTLVVASEDDFADLRHCDRVLVFAHGRVVAELDKDRTEADVLGAVEGVAR